MCVCPQLPPTIDKQGGEGLETHCTYICTLTVIGVFLQHNFYPTLSGKSNSKLFVIYHHWYGCVACVLTIIMSCLNSAKL